jgi:hypothetical protein
MYCPDCGYPFPMADESKGSQHRCEQRGYTKMFAGLMSRWMIPLEWAASKASAIRMLRSSTVSISSALPAIVCRRVWLKQFHGDESSPIAFVDLIDRADMRVIQRRGSLGFTLESAESLCVIGKVIGEELNGIPDRVATAPFGQLRDARVVIAADAKNSDQTSSLC